MRIVAKKLSKNISKRTLILWVLILRIDATNISFPPKTTINIKPQLYWNPRQDKQIYPETLASLNRMVKQLPKPEATPTNAIHWLNSPKGKMGRSLFGAYYMSGNKIKISTRALTELLAGRIELQVFLEENGLKPHPLNTTVYSFPFFEKQMMSGNTLQNAFVEKEDHMDDDWIVLEYNGPDPSISPFHMPN